MVGDGRGAGIWWTPTVASPYRPLPSPTSASATRSATVARTCRIFVFARVGFTRLLRRITYRSLSGSIQIDVPVYPVWPNERRESFAPALEYPESDGVSQPSARVEPGGMF